MSDRASSERAEPAYGSFESRGSEPSRAIYDSDGVQIDVLTGNNAFMDVQVLWPEEFLRVGPILGVLVAAPA